MTQKEILKKLLKTLKSIHKEGDRFRKFFGDDVRVLDKEWTMLEDLICDIAGIPADNTIKIVEGYLRKGYDERAANQLAGLDPKTSCRDFWTDEIYNYLIGDYSVEKTVDTLLNWEKKLKLVDSKKK